MDILEELLGKQAAKRIENDFFGWSLFHPPLPRRNHARRAYTTAEYNRKVDREWKRAMPNQDTTNTSSRTASALVSHRPEVCHPASGQDNQQSRGGLRLHHRRVKTPASGTVKDKASKSCSSSLLARHACVPVKTRCLASSRFFTGRTHGT